MHFFQKNTNKPSPTIVPVPYCASSVDYFKNINKLSCAVWLDSAKPLSDAGRYDIISALPEKLFKKNSALHPKDFISQIELYLKDKQNLVCIDQLEEKQIPFAGGLMGYFNYEFLHHNSKIDDNEKTKRQDNLPSSEVGFYSWALIQDHYLKHSYCVFLPYWTQENINERVELVLQKNTKSRSSPTYDCVWRNDQGRSFYNQNIKKIHQYILMGDTYQVNYSQKFSAIFNGDSFNAYCTLRETVPSPFSSFLNFPDISILCVSPEKFVGIEKNNDAFHALTKPIKGTQARDIDPVKDKSLAAELLESEKNKAENVMIVDLLRNDFSKNCQPHTVRVPKLFSLESYSNVHHLVSTVTGTLKPNIQPLNFMIDCFPGGSITGAPKKRAMEIIDEIEPHSRDIYCGSIFYQSIGGNLDSNISIRTMLLDKKDNTLNCWGGGGIVHDSNKEDEYAESIDKIKVLMNALGKMP